MKKQKQQVFKQRLKLLLRLSSFQLTKHLMSQMILLLKMKKNTNQCSALIAFCTYNVVFMVTTVVNLNLEA